MADTQHRVQHHPAASQSSSAPYSIPSINIATVGKEPDLLKRISAPEPNQDYQGNLSDSPSPTHSPPTPHKELPISRPSRPQALTAVDESRTSSGLTHVGHPVSLSHASVSKPLSRFDESYAALRGGGSRFPPSNRPASRSGTSSDMDWSPITTSPRTVSHSGGNSRIAVQAATISGNNNDTRPSATKSRHTSLGPTSSLELAYPATEPALPTSTYSQPVDSSVTPSANLEGPYTPAIAELPARLLDFVSSLDLVAVHHSKKLDGITALERDLKAIATLSSLALENTQRVEALAQRSLGTVRESVSLSQENVLVAQAVKQRTDQALLTLTQLRCFCENESHDVVGEQGRADLISSATALKYDIETFYQFITEPERHGEAVQPTGLAPEVLMSMSVEVAKRRHRYESMLGTRKRKRSQEHVGLSIGNDLPCPPPLKEARLRQRIVSFDRALEMEAEAAREAWDREVERRSVAPPDATVRMVEDGTAPEKYTRDEPQEEQAKGNALLAEPALERVSMGQTREQSVAPPSGQSLEHSKNDHSSQDASPKEMEALQAQRRRELKEQKFEIARFHLREQESQELSEKRKEAEKNGAPMASESQDKTEQRKEGPATIVPAAPSASSNVAVSQEGNELRCTIQSKTITGDISRKKEIEMRLAMEKQQAAAALRPAQAASAIQTSPPQAVATQKALSVKDGVLASQPILQRSSEQSRNTEGKEKNRQEIGEEKWTHASMKIQTERAKLKERTNGPPEVTMPKVASSPSVGNVVAQQTVVASPVKGQGKRSRTETPSLADQSSAKRVKPVPPIQSVNLPPRPTFQPVLPQTQSLNRENVSQCTRNPSVPPIECIVEPNGTSSTRPPVTLPTPQTQGSGLERALPIGPAAPVNISHEAQSANLRFGTSIPIAMTSSSGPGVPHLKLSADVVPKVEVQSLTVAHSPVVQHSLPRRPPNNNIRSVSNASQQNITKTSNHHHHHTLVNDSRTRMGTAEHGPSDRTGARRSISNTLPSTSAPAARTHFNPPPESGHPTDIVSNMGSLKHEIRPPTHSDDSPPVSPYTSAPANTNNGGAPIETRPSRGWAYGSPTGTFPVIGRSRDHWSPDLDRRNYPTSRIDSAYVSRPTSGTLPPRSRGGSRSGSRSYSPPPLGDSRTLAMRIEGTTDRGEVYLPMRREAYRPTSPGGAPDYDTQRRRGDRDAVNTSSTSRRPELLDRFSGSGDVLQTPRRLRGGRRGRGGVRPLEERIS
ncbi:hypothetical protein AX15_003246 [Amanita polypyramis BW_CC]|nr:hypothetical protein AX15_003246 [Amanita polypyramis BW_CC]